MSVPSFSLIAAASRTALATAVPDEKPSDATVHALLGFDHDLRCRFAAGPALRTLGIETRYLSGADLQAFAPALRPIVRSLCRCVFAGAYAETVVDATGRRLHLSGLPLPDSRGTISMALVRIALLGTSPDVPVNAGGESRPPAPIRSTAPPATDTCRQERAAGF